VKRARVAFSGAIHDAVADGDMLLLSDGRRCAEQEVVWLAPLAPRTIFAVGLNYAAHAQELSLESQREPLVFLKAANSVAGHRAHTARPPDIKFMHYECELAVVIGKAARRIRREHALKHVAGYTVANDYAVRDYLEDYYRPNLRVKSRDASTLLGPWLVDAADVPEPGKLAIRTWVNGTCTQQGSTSGMIFDVPALIEYLSGFMTLLPGDVILTGTPEGVVNVNPGDEVVTQIEGIGRLVNYVIERVPQGDTEGVAHG